MKFFVIDDKRLLNRFLTTYLRGKGHQASSTTDGSKALDVIGAGSPAVFDAVLLSTGGTDSTNGIKLLRMIREKHPELCIAMFLDPGHTDDQLAAAEKAGANGYVSKGLGPSEIYATLMRVVAEHGRSAKN